MSEEWRNIPEYPGYQASSFGRIRSSLKGKQKIKSQINKRGYKIVCVMVNGVQRNRFVHVLVLSAFKGPKPTKNHQVAHNDGKPYNNVLENLRWATPQENNLDKKIHGTFQIGDKCGASKLTEVKVRAIRKEFIVNDDNGNNINYLSEKYGTTPSNILLIVRGKTWRHIL